MMHKLLPALLLVLAAIPGDHWKADAEKSKVTFAIKGPFGKVDGSFTGLRSEIKFDPKDLAGSSVSASVDASTVNTGIGLRNRDLRKKEIWLNTDKYPRISFRSTRIERDGANYKAIGDLTLKGTTRSETIAFTFTSKGQTGEFKGHFNIDREAYKVGKTGGSVGRDVSIDLDIPVEKMKG